MNTPSKNSLEPKKPASVALADQTDDVTSLNAGGHVLPPQWLPSEASPARPETADEAQVEQEVLDDEREAKNVKPDHSDVQLSFDFETVEGFAWNESSSPLALTDYQALASQSSEWQGSASVQTQAWGDEVLVAGIQPVPLSRLHAPAGEGPTAAPPSASQSEPAATSPRATPSATADEAQPVTPVRVDTPAQADSNKASVAAPSATAASAPTEAAEQSSPPVWVAGFALLGLGGGGGGGGGATPTPAPEPTPEPTVYASLTVVPSAGQFTGLSHLTLKAFKANGESLSTVVTANDEAQHFSVQVMEAYTGPVLLRLSDEDPNAANTDYVDEATGLAKDLNTDLRVMFNLSGDAAVAVNPLTELAVLKLLPGTGGDGGQSGANLGGASSNEIDAVNLAIPVALQLSGDVAKTLPVTVDSGDFASGTNLAKAYGQALAAISGMEANTGGSTLDVLTQLASGISGAGASAVLEPALIENLILGAAKADEQFDSGAAAALNTALDGVGPAVLAISVVATPPSALTMGDTIEFQVNFNDVVVVTGGEPELRATLHLADGDHAVRCAYVSGSGSKVLTFAYTLDLQGVQESAISLDVPANALTLAGAVLSDVVGNAADVTHSAYAPSSIYAVDTIAPTVSQIAVASAQGTSAGLLNTGDAVTITVGLSEPVTVDTADGAPTLHVQVGDQTVAAVFDSVSNSGTEVNFVLTIAAGQFDVDGLSIPANALSVGGAAWSDLAGNPMVITSAQVTDNATYRVDAVAPSAPSRPDLNAADDTGASVSDNVTSRMSALTFSGVAEANSMVVLFDDKNDNATLDAGEELLRSSASALGAWSMDVDLSEGAHAVRALAIDSAGNQGTYASAAASITVDNTAPILKGFSTPDAAGSYGAGDTITLIATASETLAAGGRVLVTLSSGEQVVLIAEGGSTRLSGAYVIQDTGFSGDLYVQSYQDQAGAAVKDVAGKALATVAVSNMTNIPANTVKVDTVAPSVVAVGVASAQNANGDWLNVGDVVAFDVKLSETVFINAGSGPSLGLTLDALGASSFGAATYVSGSGTDTLRFEYVVTDGDMARAGLAIAQNGLQLGQATLQDAAGNDANLNFDAVAPNGAFRVMTTAPEVVALSLPDQAMVVGDTVQVTLTVSDDGGVAYAAIQGTIAGFALNSLTRVDATTYTAEFAVGEGGSDIAADAEIPVALTLLDAAGNASAPFTDAVSTGVTDGVDANTPQLMQVALASPSAEVVNNALNEGDHLTVRLTFSEAVFVTGVPSLPVSLGGSLTELSYVSGSGTGVLTFSRVILPGETDVDGVSFLANALMLNGGRIVDAAGMDASLSHAALSAGGYIVDTTAPVVTAFYTDKPAGEYNDAGSQISVFAQMSEAVSASSELVVQLNTGAAVTLRPMDGDATTMVGTYAVGAGENTDSLAVASITVAGVYDSAGNVIIEGSLPSNNLPDSQANANVRGAVVVDTTDPFTPAQLVLDVADNTGTQAEASSFTDTITRQTTDLSFSTTVEAGSTVRFYDGSTLLSSQWVADGDWVQHVSLTEGTHQLRVTSTDTAGNTSAPSLDLSLLIDTTAPTVSSVEVQAGSGAAGARLNAGDTVHVAVTLSELAYLDLSGGGAQPTIQLDVGGSLLTATYASGSGSNTWLFSGVIGQSMTDEDGITVVANSLQAGAGHITDVAGNVVNLTHDASVETSGLVWVDNTAPSVLNATLAGKVSDTGVLVWHDQVLVDVQFDEAVQIVGGATPTLALRVGTTLVDATYASGSGTATLRFAYDVASGLVDDNGISVPTGVVALADAGDITDMAGNALGSASFAGSSDNAAYIVDATPPTVTSLSFVSATGMEDGWINAGDTLQWRVTLSEAVNISGTPKLLLDVGGQEAYAIYDPNSGSQNLIFKIAFPVGYEDRDGIVIVANALRTDGGSLTDAQGNAVDLSHAALSALAAYPVDTLDPHVVSITSTKGNGFYKEGEQIQISAVFNEDLAGTGGVITAVLNTGEHVILDGWDGHATLSGTYVVGPTANSVDLAVTSISIGTAPFDLAGNVMGLQGEVADLGLTNLDVSRAIVVDTVAPVAPTVPDLVIADDTGVSNNDNHTRVATGTTMSGTAEAFATVTVFDDAANDGLLTAPTTEFLGEVVTGADGTWHLDLTKTLSDGSHLIRAFATDRAGNQGPVSDAVMLSVDTVKPVIVGVSIPDVAMKVGDEVVATITVEDDGGDLYYNVQGSINGFDLTQLTRLSATTYTATFIVTEGGNDVQAGDAIDVVGLSVDDSAGNRSDVLTTTIAQASDAIDANSPKVVSMSITGADDMLGGYLNAGDVVYVTVVMDEDTVVTGTPQLKLTVGTSTVLADYATSMPDDKHLVFSYTIVDGNDANGIAIPADAFVLPTGAALGDAAGNSAILAHTAVADNGAYLVDTVAPIQPGPLNLASDDDLGVSNQDNETNRTSALTLNGTAEANSTVTVFDDANDDGMAQAGEVLTTVTAGGDGVWLGNVNLAEATYAIRTIATDAAGNDSVASDVLSLIVDTTQPSVANVALGESVGLTNAYLNAGDQAHVVLSFDELVVVNTAGGTPSVTLDIGGVLVMAHYLSGSESNDLLFGYTVQRTQTDDDGISVVANSLALNGGVITDVAGNAVVLDHAAVTDDASQMVDTTAPSKPLAPGLAASDDSGFSDSDAITSTTSALSLSGAGEDGATLELFSDANNNGVLDNGESLGTTNIVGGQWTLDVDLSEGGYALRAVVIDAAGNTSQASDVLTLTVDVTAPTQPGALALVSSSDSGRSITDGVTNLNNGVTFALTAEAGASIAIYEGSTLLASTVVDGHLRLDQNLSEGVHTLFAVATDAAGNVSVDGVQSTVTIDLTPPAQPGAISLASVDDLGISDSDLLTSKSSGLTLSGTAEDNASVDLYDDVNQNGVLESNEKLGSTLAASGAWSLDVALAAGTHHLQALATDAAGNVSVASAATVLSVDTTEPDGGTVQAYDVASAGGYSRGDLVRLVFTEPVQVANVSAGHLLVSNGHSLGTGALVQADAPVDGMASVYWVTLGDAPTVVAGDVLSLNPAYVVDQAGNAATQTVEFMLPLAQSGTIQLATTAAAEALSGTAGANHFVAVGLTVADQYTASDAVLGSAAVISEITRARSLSSVNLGDSFTGGAGFDVLSIYGTADLQAGVTLSDIDRLQILGDVTLTESQLAALNADGISIDGAGHGILRIVDDAGSADLSNIRLTHLAQLDVGSDVSVVLSQANLDQIAVVSTAWTNAQVQADVGSLDWTGVTVFGGGDVLTAEGGNLGALSAQTGLVNGDALMANVNSSITAANALLSADLSAYTQTTLSASDFDAVLAGASGEAHNLTAFGDAKHWLVGDGASDVLTAGGAGDLLWGGTELLQSGSVTNTLNGGAGADVMISGSNVDTLTGGAGDDYIDAGAGTDIIRGGAGNDFIRSGTGTDTIHFEANLADNGVDLFGVGVVGDVFDFSAMQDAGGFLGLDTVGTDSVWNTTVAGLSDLANHNAAFIVLKDSPLGDAAALKALLDQTEFDTVDREGSRVVVWANTSDLVDMAFVQNVDSLNDDSVSVNTFAHMMMTTSQTPSIFLSGLSDAHFVV